MGDYRPVIYVFGWLLLGLAAAMLPPALLSAAQSDGETSAFVASISVTGFAAGGLIMATRGVVAGSLKFRQAVALTVGAWALLPAFAALPFSYESHSLSYTDAFFEATSGLTTTGSTIMVGLDETSPSILLWRSLLQWLGGFGIIGMTIAIMPFLRIGGMQIFRLESSDRSEKIIPRMEAMALSIGGIYLTLSLLCFLSYVAVGLTPFHALNHTMTTVATGGYSTFDASLGYFDSPKVHWVAILFMISGSLPFLAYYRIAQGQALLSIFDPQIKSFFTVLGVAIAALTLWRVLWQEGEMVGHFHEVSFHVVSIVTTTGYAVTDHTVWGTVAAPVFFFLAFIGGCTGSTTGGLKIFRFEIIGRLISLEARRHILPHRVMTLTYGGRRLDTGVISAVGALFFVYFACIGVLACVLGAFNLDFETAVSGAATAIANVGPGIGPVIGPAGNFSSLPDGAKWALAAGMILGRLEIMGVLVLLTPRFHRS